MERIKNLEIVVTENDKMPYFEIKYKEEGTENYANIYTGNDIFKGWIMTYYKLLKEKGWLYGTDGRLYRLFR